MPLKDAALTADLERLSESVLRGIRLGNERIVSRGLEVYLQLIEVFQEHLERLGITHSRQSAQMDLGSVSPFAGWDPLTIVRDSYVSFLREALESEHRDTIRTVLYFPFSVAMKAISNRDNYSLTLFLSIPPRFVYQALEDLESSGVASLVRDRLWRHPTELTNYGIGSVLRRMPDVRTLDFAMDVAISVLKWFNTLLKAAIDAHRLDDFRLFLSKIEGLFSGLSWEIEGYDRWLMLRDFALADELEHLSSERTAAYERFEDVTNRLERCRRAIRFGFCAWIVELEKRGEFSNAEAWLAASDNYSRLVQLVDVLSDCLDRETQNLLGWDHWLLDPDEEEVKVLDFDGILFRGFLVLAMRVLDRSPDYTIQLPKETERARELGRVVAEDGRLRQALKSLRTQPSALLPDEDDERWNELETVFDQLAERWNERWTDTVIQAELDEERIDSFREHLWRGYKERATLRSLLRKAGSLRTDVAGPTQRETWLRVYQHLPRAYFVAESNTTVDYLAHDLGTRLAGAEEAQFMNDLAARLTDQTVEYADEASYVQGIHQAVRKLKRRYAHLALLVSDSAKMVRMLASEPSFEWNIQAASAPIAAPRATYLGVPLYTIRAEESVAIVASLAAGLEWTEYVPEENTAEGSEQAMKFSISPMSRGQASKAVKNDPQGFRRLVEEEAETPDEVVAQRLTQEMVLLEAARSFDWDVKDIQSLVSIRWNAPKQEALDIEDPDAAFDLGVTLYGSGDVEGARAAWEKGIELGHGKCALNLGYLLREAGDMEGARAAWKKGIELGDSASAFDLGLLLREADDIEGVRAAWEKGIELGHGKCALNLGNLLREAGDMEGARAAWKRGTKLGNGASASNLGTLLEKAGDTEGARTAWERGIELGSANCAFKLGNLLHELGDMKGAHATWKQGIELGSGDSAFNLGVLLDEAGDTKEARAAWEKGVELGDADSAFNLGNLLHELGDMEGARTAWKQGIELGDADSAFNLGNLLHELGDMEGARAAWEKGVELGDADSALNLDAILEAAGDPEETRAGWEEEVELGDSGSP